MDDSPLKNFATGIVRMLVGAGHRALFAGGCVRDMLRGAEPNDFDVATSARPSDVMKLFGRTVPVGAAFGVVRVLSPGDDPLCVEVATFRGDGAYTDGRHPDTVTYTNEVEDVKRRDFTINGLLFDPLKDELLDYVGGREDLDRKLIRAIGDPKLRFAEDHLRMLRAVRFAARLDFEIDGHTLGAIKDCAANVMTVSAERIRDELNLMLTGPNPRLAFELLKKCRLLRYVLPDIDALQGVPQPAQFHPEGDVWEHTLMLLGQLCNSPLTVALGALLHDVGKPATIEMADRIRFNEHEKVGAGMAEKIMEHLKYSREQIERVSALVRGHMAFKDVKKMRPATLKRFLRQAYFDEHLALHKLDCLASHGDLGAYNFCVNELARETPETLRPEPLITGHDLIALGLKPGPQFAEILKDVEDRQLEQALTDKSAALEYIKTTHLK
ncbi:MAG TPA: CCA tRNA nucleotidyltransferase [Planctomycetota bacterium]|nr:CCA tRNA nucleotidyltransferase [Planctomycetota bacterium]